jgi:citrate synthase
MTKRVLWETKISKALPDNCLIRGYPHTEIIENLSYTEGAFLTLVGRLPTRAEVKMMDAILNCILELELQSVTVSVARHIVSGNPEVAPAVAGGLLPVGRRTTSPQEAADLINGALNMMEEEGLSREETAKRIVHQYRKDKKRFPGFGHPSLRKGDYRAISLRKVAEREGIIGEKTLLYEAIHSEFVRQTGRTDIPINVDGMMACLMMEMSLDPKVMAGIAMLSVMPGIIAHAVEEIKNLGPLRYPDPETVQYTGEPERHLPREMMQSGLEK